MKKLEEKPIPEVFPKHTIEEDLVPQMDTLITGVLKSAGDVIISRKRVTSRRRKKRENFPDIWKKNKNQE